MIFEYPDGATPLDPSESKGLKLPHIATRDQLNEWEQAGILEAELKHFSRKQTGILTEAFLLRLHKHMFGKVWAWAGKYRTSDKNIGIPHWEVAVKVRNLCEDAELWIEAAKDPADEIAVRIHHRLVSIHPFVNGNGRHARLVADLLLTHTFGRPRFSWGRHDLLKAGEARSAYLEALRAADRRDYSRLLEFVRM